MSKFINKGMYISSANKNAKIANKLMFNKKVLKLKSRGKAENQDGDVSLVEHFVVMKDPIFTDKIHNTKRLTHCLRSATLHKATAHDSSQIVAGHLVLRLVFFNQFHMSR
jgi:hypothetical protein